MKNIILIIAIGAVAFSACNKDDVTGITNVKQTQVIDSLKNTTDTNSVDSLIVAPHDTIVKIDSVQLLKNAIDLATKQTSTNLRGDEITVIKNSDNSITKFYWFKMFKPDTLVLGFKINITAAGKVKFLLYDDDITDTIGLKSILLFDGSIKGEFKHEGEILLSIHLKPNNSFVMFNKRLRGNTILTYDKDGNLLTEEKENNSGNIKWTRFYDDIKARPTAINSGFIQTFTREKVDGRIIVEQYNKNVLLSTTITYPDGKVEVMKNN